MAKEGVRFKGKLYSDWQSLRAAIAANKRNDPSAVSPSEWVRRNPGAAGKLGVGLGPEGKVVQLTASGKTKAEVAEEAEQAQEDEQAREDFFESTRQDLRDLGITDDAFIDDIIGKSIDTEDPLAILDAVASDPRVDNFFPGFTSLVAAGVIDPVDFAGYKDYRRGVNAIYRRNFGRDASNEEFLQISGEGMDLGFVNSFFTFRTGFMDVFKQFKGRDPTAEEIDAAFGSGLTPERIGRGFQAEAITEARGPSIQRFAQRSGTQFTQEELEAFGRAEVGLGGTFGESVQLRVDEALRRAQRVFQGQLARGPLTLPPASRRDAADVGA